MKSLQTLLFILLCLNCSFSQNLPSFAFQLEKMASPPGYGKQIALHQGITYCGTNKGLYFSDDNGVSWQLHPGISSELQVSQIVATDSIILLRADTVEREWNHITTYGKYYRSTDHGISFDSVYQVEVQYASPISNGGFHNDYTPFKIVQDSIIYIEFTRFGHPNPPSFFYRSKDFGETWDFFNLPENIYTHAERNNVISGDTIFYRIADSLRLSKEGYENPFLVVPIAGSYLPYYTQGFLEIYNGTAYFLHNDTCNILDYNSGQSFTQVALPQAMKDLDNLTRNEEHLYFTNKFGLFHSTLPNFSQVDTLFYLAHYSDYPYSVYNVNITDSGIYLTMGTSLFFSEDNGVTWQDANGGLTGFPNVLVSKGDTLISRSGNEWYYSVDESSSWHSWVNKELAAMDLEVMFTHHDMLYAVKTSPTSSSNYQLMRLTSNNSDWELLLDSLYDFNSGKVFYEDSMRLFVGNKVSYDFGETWQTLFSLPNQYGVRFAKGDTLISSQIGSAFLRSVDNGQTWVNIQQEIDFIAGSRLFQLVNPGVALVSDDWGLTWNNISNPLGAPYHRRAIRTEKGIFALGDGPNDGYTTIVYSQDGIEWYKIKPDFFKINVPLYIWSYPSSDFGAVIMHNNRLYLAGDGIYRSALFSVPGFPNMEIQETLICEGDSIALFGTSYARAGIYTAYGSANPGTVGNLVQLNLTVSEPMNITKDTTITIGGTCFGIPILQDTFIIINVPNQNGCVDTISYIVETVTNVQEQNLNLFTYTISPNPANDKIIVRTTNSSSETLNCSIYSVNGQLVKQHIFHESNTTIDVSSLSPGFYLYAISKDYLPIGKGKFVIYRAQ